MKWTSVITKSFRSKYNLVKNLDKNFGFAWCLILSKVAFFNFTGYCCSFFFFFAFCLDGRGSSGCGGAMALALKGIQTIVANCF